MCFHDGLKNLAIPLAGNEWTVQDPSYCCRRDTRAFLAGRTNTGLDYRVIASAGTKMTEHVVHPATAAPGTGAGGLTGGGSAATRT